MMYLSKAFLLCFLMVFAVCVHESHGKLTAKYWIDKYNMTINIEGGWFTETYRSTEKIDNLPERYGQNATRVFGTHIYYLLENKDFSLFHRLKSDEVWHFYHGAKLTLFVIDHETGELTRHFLGKSARSYVATVRHGDWYAARLTFPGEGKYCLLGITVSPGFEIEDYYQPTAGELISKFPQHKKTIESLTRS